MSSQQRTVCLVPCASRKGDTPARARDLYRSPLFLKMRAVVERLGVPWFILSAKHGLLRPEERIDPYDLTLNEMRVTERRSWSRNVIRQMEGSLLPVERVIVLAGQRYREFLMDWLMRHASRVETPLAELRIGEQLQFLEAWLRSATRGDGLPPATASEEPVHAPAKAAYEGPQRVSTPRGTGRSSRYDPLRTFLETRTEAAVELSFSEIDRMVGGLPRSAYAHRPWWANDSGHSQARAWLDAGRQASVDWSSRTVRFLGRVPG